MAATVIDTSAVIVTVTQAGGAQPIETGTLIFDPTPTDLFNGQISLGDLAERRLHADRDRHAAPAGRSEAAHGRLRRRQRTRRSSSSRRCSAGTTRTASWSRSSPPIRGLTGQRRRDHRRHAGHAHAPSADPARHVYRGIFDFNGPNPPLVGEQLLIVTVDSNTGRRTEVRVVFDIDNDGPDDHDDHRRRRARSSATSCSSRRRSSTRADVLDSSVIAVIGDERRPLFELPLKPAGGRRLQPLLRHRAS